MRVSKGSIQSNKLSFFGDASSKNSDFMVLGGFAVRSCRQRGIEGQISDIRNRGGISREFHWKEYRGGARANAYEELVSFGFQLVREKKAAFHAIVCDFREFDHRREEGQTRDTSINKIYWNLCLHRLAKFYGKKCQIHIRLDAGEDCEDICAMRSQLCAVAYRTHGTRPNCIATIEPMNSKASGLIQMADVFVGGIASQMNGNRVDTPKGKLADFIRVESGRGSWGIGTQRDEKFLTVWHFKGG